MSILDTYLNNTSIGARPKLLWLFPGMVLMVVIVYQYLITVTHPVWLGGLYFAVSDHIVANNFLLPERLPHYTAGGVPLAYPPLGFYIIGILSTLIGDPLFVARYLPPALYLLVPIAIFVLSDELFDAPTAAISVAVFATIPIFYKYYLSSAGIIWMLAQTALLISAWLGIKLHKSDSWRWVPYTALTVAFVGATHPVVGVWAIVTQFCAWIYFSRTKHGLSKLAVVGVIAAALTSPWYLSVLLSHGIDPFLWASSTHGGLFSIGIIQFPPSTFAESQLPLPVWRLLAFAGLFLLPIRGKAFVPLWYVATKITLPGSGFPLFVPLLAAGTITAVIEISVPLIAQQASEWTKLQVSIPQLWKATVVVGLTAILVAGSVAAVPQVQSSVTSNTHLETAEIEAMEWVAAETPRESKFIVLGRSELDWFPFYANRTVVATNLGSEWEDPETKIDHRAAILDFHDCRTGSCLTQVADDYGLEIDYIFYMRERSTISSDIAKSVEKSEKYTVVYREAGVVIVRVD